jgi:hypothetical protein
MPDEAHTPRQRRETDANEGPSHTWTYVRQ